MSLPDFDYITLLSCQGAVYLDDQAYRHQMYVSEIQPSIGPGYCNFAMLHDDPSHGDIYFICAVQSRQVGAQLSQ